MRLALVGRLAEHFQQQIATAVDGLSFVAPDAPCDALLAWEVDIKKVATSFEANPELRWMHSGWAGVSPQLLALLEGRATVLTNGSGAHAPAIAEFVLAALLSHYRRLPALRALQAQRSWQTFHCEELRGRVAGILGTGDIGRNCAELLRPFGVRLRGLNRSGRPVAGIDELYAREQLRAFLDGLDILILAAPLTPESRGMIDAAALAALPPHCYLVNVGRGAVVDEQAMIAALASGRLAGAALDVFVEEPLPADSPLWELPNVLVSPHCSDHTGATDGRGVELFVDNLRRFARGEPLLNVVDRQAGY
jgi:phosphoglycerate dehydrogenase-like enzyme